MSVPRRHQLITALALSCSFHQRIDGVTAFMQLHSHCRNSHPSNQHVSRSQRMRLYDILPRSNQSNQGGNDGDDGKNANNHQNENESGKEDDVIANARAKLEAMMAPAASSEGENHNQQQQQQQDDVHASPSSSSSGEASPKRYDFSLRPSQPTDHDNNDNEEERNKSRLGRLHPDHIFDELLTPPPLTTIGRARCEAEIECLSSLLDSDAALSDLWTLWFGERGPHAASQLKEAEQLSMSGPAYWAEAEEKLRGLVEEHGVHWSEPVNRLATLLYLQGRYQESKEMCEVVLSVKPYHFGALSGIVMVCAGLGDVNAARLWADRRLPPLRPDGDTTERRVLWVERAVSDATRQLERAERRIGEEFEHCDEEEGSGSSSSSSSSNGSAAAASPKANKDATTKSIVMDDDFDDAWQ